VSHDALSRAGCSDDAERVDVVHLAIAPRRSLKVGPAASTKKAPLCVKGPDRIGRIAARRVVEPRYAQGTGAALGAVGGAVLASRTSCR
jgi:hypothetical protein